MPPLRVGVVGVGHLGQHHARIYAEMQGVELAWIVDVNAENAQKLARKYECGFHVDYRAVDGLDAVSIAVPTSLHYEVASHFLERGIHTMVEKPICSKLSDAEALARLSEARNLILQVGHIERFNPAVKALRSRANNPQYIESHRLGPINSRCMDVDVIRDLMIHDLDIVLSLVDSPLEDVQATGVATISPHVDLANVRLTFANGCVANMNASRISLSPMRKLRIFQPSGYLSLDFAKQELNFVQLVPDKKSLIPGIPFKLSREKVRIKKQEPLKAELEAFVRSVRRQSPPLVSARDAIQALQVTETILQRIAQTQAKANLQG